MNERPRLLVVQVCIWHPSTYSSSVIFLLTIRDVPTFEHQGSSSEKRAWLGEGFKHVLTVLRTYGVRQALLSYEPIAIARFPALIYGFPRGNGQSTRTKILLMMGVWSAQAMMISCERADWKKVLKIEYTQSMTWHNWVLSGELGYSGWTDVGFNLGLIKHTRL